MYHLECCFWLCPLLLVEMHWSKYCGQIMIPAFWPADAHFSQIWKREQSLLKFFFRNCWQVWCFEPSLAICSRCSAIPNDYRQPPAIIWVKHQAFHSLNYTYILCCYFVVLFVILYWLIVWNMNLTIQNHHLVSLYICMGLTVFPVSLSSLIIFP